MWRLGACNDYSLPFMTVLLSWLCYNNDVICSAAHRFLDILDE